MHEIIDMQILYVPSENVNWPSSHQFSCGPRSRYSDAREAAQARREAVEQLKAWRWTKGGLGLQAPGLCGGDRRWPTGNASHFGSLVASDSWLELSFVYEHWIRAPKIFPRKRAHIRGSKPSVSTWLEKHPFSNHFLNIFSPMPQIGLLPKTWVALATLPSPIELKRCLKFSRIWLLVPFTHLQSPGLSMS